MQDKDLFNGVIGKYTDGVDENGTKRIDDMEIASPTTSSISRPRKENLKVIFLVIFSEYRK